MAIVIVFFLFFNKTFENFSFILMINQMICIIKWFAQALGDAIYEYACNMHVCIHVGDHSGWNYQSNEQKWPHACRLAPVSARGFPICLQSAYAHHIFHSWLVLICSTNQFSCGWIVRLTGTFHSKSNKFQFTEYFWMHLYRWLINSTKCHAT